MQRDQAQRTGSVAGRRRNKPGDLNLPLSQGRRLPFCSFTQLDPHKLLADAKHTDFSLAVGPLYPSKHHDRHFRDVFSFTVRRRNG